MGGWSPGELAWSSVNINREAGHAGQTCNNLSPPVRAWLPTEAQYLLREHQILVLTLRGEDRHQTLG